MDHNRLAILRFGVGAGGRRWWGMGAVLAMAVGLGLGVNWIGLSGGLAVNWGPMVGAGVAALVAIGIAMVRRPAVPAMTLGAFVLGMVLLALAVGGATWHRPVDGGVVVMVDLSASTRGAGYRERAALERRIDELMGPAPARVIYFSDANRANAPEGAVMGDLPAARTVYAPPAAAAVVLFSDGRFELPEYAPPTFAVADPLLDEAEDARVDRLETRGNELAVTVHNGGGARRLEVDGAELGGRAATRPTAIEAGSMTLSGPIVRGAAVAHARLNAGDRWPENDALSLPLAPPMRSEKWFVSAGGAGPGEGWQVIRPAELSVQAGAYVGASVIVLDNLASTDLSGAEQAALEQYVRDLGGALVVAGGDRAFAQGLYVGTPLETLSPLASVPPTPSVHWMLLADSSGSMSQGVGETTRWQLAAGAIGRLLANLPPEDPVSVGSFAAELKWWSDGRSARETAGLNLPPGGVGPNGPTNLAAALERIAKEADGGLPAELLVVSDADTEIDHPEALAQQLKTKRIRLHLLAIGDGRGLEALRTMAAATGGTLRRELDPRKWAGEVRQLLSAAWPERLIRTDVNAQYVGDLAGLKARAVSPWDRTWLKNGATELAKALYGAESVPLAARWNVGSGEVIACGFSGTGAEVEAMARLIARPPRDPRFTVRWDAGPRLTVRVDAIEGGKYMNGERLKLELAEEQTPTTVQRFEIPQTGPGRYELTLPAPRDRMFATLRDDARVLDRVAIAGRYAPEFDRVGNDYEALRRLASATGGKVIDRAWKGRIDFPFAEREVALAPWLGLAGAVVLGLGLARWRVGH